MSLAHLLSVARSGSCGLLVVATCACVQFPIRNRAPIPTTDLARPPGTGPSLPPQSTLLTSPAVEAFPLNWMPGQVLLQGHVGARYLSELTVSPSGSPEIELDDDEYEVLPVIGGGAQWKLAGNRLDFGLEGFLAFSSRSDLEAFASSGGTTVAAFDVNLLVFEVYGGPFVSRFFGDSLRIYTGAGPLLQWVGYDQDDGSTEEESADGSGGGVYVRAGFEFLLPSGKLAGLGARWSESSIDFEDDFGELDLAGLEVFFTYSYGLQPRSKYAWQ